MRSIIANLYFTASPISQILQLIYHNLTEHNGHLIFFKICPDKIHCASAKTDSVNHYGTNMYQTNIIQI
jgi:hypothetical protein